jgi:hypothetical protein
LKILTQNRDYARARMSKKKRRCYELHQVDLNTEEEKLALAQRLVLRTFGKKTFCVTNSYSDVIS